MIESGSIQKNLSRVLQNIDDACRRSGRDPQEILLVAVSKKQPIEKIREFLEAASYSSRRIVLGENYVQEWRSKREFLGAEYPCHLIGPLQSNKVKHAVRLFELIESVHSAELLHEIAKQALRMSKTQRVFLQVNISADPGKSGFSVQGLKNFFEEYQAAEVGVSIEGLMTITEFFEEPESALPDFQALKNLALEIESRYSNKIANRNHSGCLEISMGMSADYAVAIEAGASVVRVGTAIFGERT